MGRLHRTIDVERYFRLPRDARVRFDVWLKDSGLMDKKVVHLELDEGYVTIERLAVDDNGKYLLSPDGKEVVLTTERIVVKAPPPREAFEDVQ